MTGKPMAVFRLGGGYVVRRKEAGVWGAHINDREGFRNYAKKLSLSISGSF
jgi:hypothetical protein